MTHFAPRGRRGPGFPSSSGITLVELIFWLMVVSWIAVMLTQGYTRLEEAIAMRSAVHETTVAFYRARATAIARNRNVGLKFQIGRAHV